MSETNSTPSSTPPPLPPLTPQLPPLQLPPLQQHQQPQNNTSVISSTRAISSRSRRSVGINTVFPEEYDDDNMHTPGSGAVGLVTVIFLQIIFLIIFGFFTDYHASLLPKMHGGDDSPIVPKYPLFQDIHVMIFIGFAFLMTFLKKYGYSATGFNLWVGALVIQWAIIMRGVFALEKGKILISLDNMIGADIAAAAVLISMGALLGRITPLQLLAMGFFEIIFFAINEHINIELFRITDVGGSITVHAFGAYFGLAASFILRPTKADTVTGDHEGASYTSDIFAMVGSIFLWIFWPSFNGALVDGDQQERAILHTYLSLAACTVTTFAISALVHKDKKFDMVHVQNSTLAGGVAVGSCVNLILRPWGAVLIGFTAAIISVMGYAFLTPALFKNMRLADTCGVHNLHGMPAVFSAVVSAIYAAVASKDLYGAELYQIFPAMEEFGNSTETPPHHVVGGYGRTASTQGSYQLIGILVTLTMAVLSGVFTGLVLKLPAWNKLSLGEMHRDDQHWVIEEEEEHKDK